MVHDHTEIEELKNPITENMVPYYTTCNQNDTLKWQNTDYMKSK